MKLQEGIDLGRVLEQVSAGDSQAFAALHERTSEHLLWVATGVLRDRHLAEDVLQDVYLKVWKQAHRYDPSLAGPMTWLATLVRHHAIDVLRSRRSSLMHEPGQADDSPGDTAADPAPAAGAVLDGARIETRLQRLGARYRQTLALVYYHGMSHSEVAQHLGAPLGSVKVWVRRGLDHLRRGIDGGEGNGAPPRRHAASSSQSSAQTFDASLALAATAPVDA